MVGYRPTQIRKPADETEFEKNCVPLFAAFLDDPNVSRVGTRGQEQDGVDIRGLRNRNPLQVVGVQCKLKAGNKKLTKKEVNEEVRKALAFTPPLTEYFIVTTAKNDTSIQQYALALMQEQENLGRRILIEVWGWDTLQEKIDQYDAAKQAFDPGFSPALEASDKKLDALVAQQSKLATKSDLASLVKSLEKNGTEISVQLPAKFADRELRDELSKALRRRGFSQTDTGGELSSLAIRAIRGDLAQASPALKAEICERAARANAVPETREVSQQLRDYAAKFDSTRDLFVVDALLKDAFGDTDAALRELKTRDDIDSRSVLLVVLIRQRGIDSALQWVSAEKLNIVDFSPVGVLNLIISAIANGCLDEALKWVSEIPPSYFDEIAVLHLLRAQLALTSLLPSDQKSTLLQGLPVNPRWLQFASGEKADHVKRAALSDMELLLNQAQDLGIEYLADYFSEIALWLQLEMDDLRAAARTTLEAEIANPKTTLTRVRLALAYGVPFNSDALLRNLTKRKDIGGWTRDERLAAFLIVASSGDEKLIGDFIEAHRDDLFELSDFNHSYIAAIEIDSLARSGRTDEARDRLKRYRGRFLTDEEAIDAEATIAAIQNGGEVDLHRERYEQSGSLAELRMLVGELRVRHDTRLLAQYAPALARITLTLSDFDVAIKSLYQMGRDAELITLTEELPDLVGLDPDYEAIKGWALYRLGRLMEARVIARSLFTSRNESSDRELAINTAVETGDWGYLQAVLAQEVARIDALPAKDCMRLARLALETNSPYVDRFRDASLAKAPDDPQVHLSAYILSTERGEEDRDSHAQEWFQKAFELSSGEGPVQRVSLREVIDRASGWRERVDSFDRALRHAEIPMFVFARALNRRVFDLTLGQVRRNLDTARHGVSYPVFSFSGARPATKLSSDSVAALDVTALITLEYLELLDVALGYFKHVVIAPRTMTFLFAERQFIRIQQPSQLAKAKRIQALIVSGRLKVAPRPVEQRTSAAKEIGQELATLLEHATAQGGLVVRSPPVIKLGSYLDEEADISSYASVLTDTHAILEFLATKGKIDAVTHRSAESYLRHVDKGWDSAPAINSTTVLYLDDLTVTYLDHVNLLEALVREISEVFVHDDVNEQTQQILAYAAHTGELLAAIEAIRNVVAAAIETRHISFSVRRSSLTEDGDDSSEEADPSDVWPTTDLLSDLTQIDIVIADDRYLNKLTNWRDRAGCETPNASTLDILGSLHADGQLDDSAYWLALHKLRVGGFYAVPLDLDELLHRLGSAPMADGVVCETPELRAIRESVALPQISESFIASEEAWLVNARVVVYKAIRQVWLNSTNVALAETHGNWLLSILPNPLEWCLDPDNDISWATARQQMASQAAILLIFPELRKERQHRYFAWIEKMLGEPMREGHPEIWDSTLEALKSYLAQLWEGDDDDA